MRFKIEIEMDNAAFEEQPGMEVGRILKKLVQGLPYSLRAMIDGDETTLRDFNGNVVGKAVVVDD